MADRAHIRYSPLSTEQDRPPQRQRHRHRHRQREPDLSTSDDPRFSFDPFNRVPWKSIVLALFLLSFGTLCLLVSYLVFTGHMGGDSSQVYGFLTIGILVFLPGFYETRIAYYAMRGAKGYSFSQIPEY